MLIRISLLLCVVCVIVLAGCSKTEPTNQTNATTGNANTAATKTTPTTTAPTTASTGEKIGVAECDEFLAAYESCVTGKVPEAQRAQFKTGIEQWRSSWKKLADNPQTKPTLVGICKQTIETARTSMKAFNCTF
jgi:hypothetical protein